MIDNNDWYTISDLANQIGMSKKTVWSWIRHGKLQSIRYGARHRISESEWQRFFADCNNALRTKPHGEVDGRTCNKSIRPGAHRHETPHWRTT